MRILFFIVLGLIFCNCRAQVVKDNYKMKNEMKIDSVFSYYFKLMDIEVGNISESELDADLYYSLNDGSDTLKILKDLPLAIDVVGKLSNMEIPLAEKASDMLLTKEMVLKWKNWYSGNRQHLFWNPKLKEPDLPNRMKGSK